jgi:hypothetical protein
MKKLVYSTRTKWSYGISGAAFIAGVILVLMEYKDAGTFLSGGGVSFALSTAVQNGHLTKWGSSNGKRGGEN